MICHTATIATLLAGLAEDPRPDTIGSVDSAVLPARCHWAREQDADLCAPTLAALEVAWPAQVDGMGFHAPMPDDDGILDIYITNQWTEGGAYALGTYADEDDSDGRMGSHAYLAISPQVGEGLIASYLHHEFNHVLQYGTDFAENELVLWEGTANVVALYEGPPADLAEWGIADFQATPWVGLLSDGYMLSDDYGLYSWYEYGSMLWNLYLEESWGSGVYGAVSAEVWALGEQEGWENEPDMLDAEDVLTGDWRAALLDFSAQRILLGTPEAPDWMDGLDDPSVALDVPVEVDLAEAADGARVQWPVGPMETGVVYLRLTHLDPDQEYVLAVDEEASASVDWAFATAMVSGGVVVTRSDEGTLFSVAGGAPDDGALVVGVVNLGTRDLDGDDDPVPADLVLEVRPVSAGDTGGDTGGAWADESGKRGCGCAAAPVGALPLGVLLALGIVGARRREDSAPRG